jgi:hypothetical protein
MKSCEFVASFSAKEVYVYGEEETKSRHGTEEKHTAKRRKSIFNLSIME